MSLQVLLEANAKYPTVTAAGRDDKAWAKRILYRQEHGDKELSSIQLRFAREAMDIKLEAN